MVIAATFGVAALVFAPSGAFAHGGHSHSSTPEQVVNPEVARSVAPVTTTALADVEERRRLTIGSDTRSVLASHLPESPQTCPGGCCHSYGAGCCAAFISEPVAIGVPMLGRSRLDLVVFGGAGITPDALPEPPKSLV